MHCGVYWGDINEAISIKLLVNEGTHITIFNLHELVTRSIIVIINVIRK